MLTSSKGEASERGFRKRSSGETLAIPAIFGRAPIADSSIRGLIDYDFEISTTDLTGRRGNLRPPGS
jgi:hypothetical protein